MNECYNVNPELIDEITSNTQHLTNSKQIKQYIFDKYGTHKGRKYLEIYKNYILAEKNYYNATNEINAYNIGKESKERIKYELDFRRGMGETSAVRKEWQIRTRPQYSPSENEGTNQTNERTRENGQSSKTRDLSDAQRGIADDTSIDDVYNTDKVLKKVKKEPDSIVKDLIIPISSRLDEIAPALKHKLRRFEMESSLSENNLMKEVKPFIDKIGKMKSIDWAKYDLALKNGNIDLIQRFNEQYNLNDEYKAMQLMSFFYFGRFLLSGLFYNFFEM